MATQIGIVERDGAMWTVTPLDQDGLRVPECSRSFATEAAASRHMARLEAAEGARQRGEDPEYAPRQ